MNPQSLRTDRILQEIHATGGDVESATRYAATLGHPAFREEIPVLGRHKVGGETGQIIGGCLS